MQSKPVFRVSFSGKPEGEAMVRWALNEVVVTPSYGSDTLLIRITLCQVRVDDVSIQFGMTDTRNLAKHEQNIEHGA